MTKIEAYNFLEENQPMPCDEMLTKEHIEKYEEVRKFFMENKDEKCIPLLLNSFGGKDGFGVYQMVEDVILMFDKKEVITYLNNALNSSYESVIYWCIQIASSFPDVALYDQMIRFLDKEDEDIKLATISALAQFALNDIKVNEVVEAIKKEIRTSLDDDVKEFAEEILEDIYNGLGIN